MSPSVIIVGAGPVGLTAALLLASFGVRVVVIERLSTPPRDARAVALDDECLRVWQACGLEDAIREDWEGGEEDAVICTYYDARGRPFLYVRQRESDLGYPDAVVIHQGRIGAKLLDAARRAPSITLLLGHEAVSVREERAEVVVQGNGPGNRPFSLRGSWLIGCDGGKSIVRTAVGVDLVGESLRQPWLIADIDDDGGARCVEIHCGGGGASVTLPLPHGVRRIERMLEPGAVGEWLSDDGEVRQRLADVWPGARDAVILDRTIRRFSSRVATRWRVGRVFLAGDAAHVTPPFAGQGMASGIRDAANLAFKLAGVCQGWLDEGVLETYELERRPHQRRMDTLARRLGRVMAPGSAIEEALTHSGLRLLSCSGLLVGPWLLRGPAIRQTIRQGFLEPAGLAGHYLPQPWVNTRTGGRRRLDSLLGPRMTWIALGDGREAGRLPDRLVGPHDSVLVEGRDFEDPERRLQRRFGEGCAALVRPDRVVHSHLTRAAVTARLKRRTGCSSTGQQSGSSRVSSLGPRWRSALGVFRTAPI